MAGDRSKSALVTAQKNEYRKTRFFYDVSTGRQTFIVEAAKDVRDGGPCIVTQFAYADALTLVVQGTTEFEGQWDEAWDIVETTPS